MIHKLEMQMNEEKFGVIAIKNVWDQAAKGNRKLLSVRIGKNWDRNEFQIDCAS